MVDARLRRRLARQRDHPAAGARRPVPLDPPLPHRSARRRRTSSIAQSLTQPMLDFLMAAVASRLNIIVSGGTGAGKTTLLNVLSGFISEGERIITIEDAAELMLRQRHVVRLETRPPNIEGKGAVKQRDLVINALRMRPDRIIVGEVRGDEALDMLQAMNTGHDGSLTTIHANSPRDALYRLDTMVAMANLQLPERAVRQQIASAVDLIVQISRLSDGTPQGHRDHRDHRHGERRHHACRTSSCSSAPACRADGKVHRPLPRHRHPAEVRASAWRRRASACRRRCSSTCSRWRRRSACRGPIVLVFAVVFGVVVGAFWLFVAAARGSRRRRRCTGACKGEHERRPTTPTTRSIERQPKHDRPRLEGLAATRRRRRAALPGRADRARQHGRCRRRGCSAIAVGVGDRRRVSLLAWLSPLSRGRRCRSASPPAWLPIACVRFTRRAPRRASSRSSFPRPSS